LYDPNAPITPPTVYPGEDPNLAAVLTSAEKISKDIIDAYMYIYGSNPNSTPQTQPLPTTNYYTPANVGDLVYTSV
jgi:hypothetical protein